MITPEVDRLRLQHDIPGMIVLQFEIADPDFDIDTVEQNSVCYTGTHDNDTSLGWFRGSGADTRSEKEVLATQTRALNITVGTESTIHLDMIRLAFSSKAALSVAPMQDYLGLGSEARLNVPGTTMNNWRWRLDAGQLHEEFLESTTDPYYDGSFTFGPRGGHGWRPYSSAELLRIMAEHIAANAPPGTSTSGWR